MASNILMADV